MTASQPSWGKVRFIPRQSLPSSVIVRVLRLYARPPFSRNLRGDCELRAEIGYREPWWGGPPLSVPSTGIAVQATLGGTSHLHHWRAENIIERPL